LCLVGTPEAVGRIEKNIKQIFVNYKKDYVDVIELQIPKDYTSNYDCVVFCIGCQEAGERGAQLTTTHDLSYLSVFRAQKDERKVVAVITNCMEGKQSDHQKELIRKQPETEKFLGYDLQRLFFEYEIEKLKTFCRALECPKQGSITIFIPSCIIDYDCSCYQQFNIDLGNENINVAEVEWTNGCLTISVGKSRGITNLCPPHETYEITDNCSHFDHVWRFQPLEGGSRFSYVQRINNQGKISMAHFEMGRKLGWFQRTNKKPNYGILVIFLVIFVFTVIIGLELFLFFRICEIRAHNRGVPLICLRSINFFNETSQAFFPFQSEP